MKCDVTSVTLVGVCLDSLALAQLFLVADVLAAAVPVVVVVVVVLVLNVLVVAGLDVLEIASRPSAARLALCSTP